MSLRVSWILNKNCVPHINVRTISGWWFWPNFTKYRSTYLCNSLWISVASRQGEFKLHQSRNQGLNLSKPVKRRSIYGNRASSLLQCSKTSIEAQLRAHFLPLLGMTWHFLHDLEDLHIFSFSFVAVYSYYWDFGTGFLSGTFILFSFSLSPLFYLILVCLYIYLQIKVPYLGIWYQYRLITCSIGIKIIANIGGFISSVLVYSLKITHTTKR